MIESCPEAPGNRLSIFSILTLTLVVLAGLFIYKWGGAFRTLAKVETAGTYQASVELIPTAGLPFLFASGARTVNYLATVWPALLFGVLIAGLVRAFISPKDVTKLLGPRSIRQQLIGGVVGMPLMLCSCCIAPIFTSVHARGARLGASLAIMLSSPSLNIAALALTFMLFQWEMAFARVMMAVFAVFVLPLILEWLAGGEASARPVRELACSTEPVVANTPIQVIKLWATASGRVAMTTLPVIVLGVFTSGLLARTFEHPVAPGIPAGLTIAVVALVATLIALPTFFEIPFSLLLLASGFPAGAVVTMLFAGPAINIPSLLTLARVASAKLAMLSFLGLWLTAIAGGLLFEFL